MIQPEEIQRILTQKLPGSEITVQDLTGTRDHFEVHVAWSGFKGKGLIQQHQAVNAALGGPLEDGRIHALKIKTYAAEA